MTDMEQGFILSGMGIVITFSALGLLILLILLLRTIFPAGEIPPDSLQQKKSLGQESDREDKRRKAAAAAVAVFATKLKSENNSDLGKTLESPPGNWWKRALERNQSKE